MKKILSILLIASMAFFTACEVPEDFSGSYTDDGAQLITATFLDGTGGFYSEGTAPFGEEIKIVFPYYYPEESSNEIDITQMRLTANLPNNVIVTPGLAVHDLTQPVEITITAANGKVTKHRIVSDIRKSSKAQILEFSLPEAQMGGFIIESQKLIGLVSGGMDLSDLTPVIKVSPHATISPDPSVPQNFNEPVVYTVTAHDGTQVQYTVKTITPNKVSHGIRKGSARLLWQKSGGDLNFTEHMETAIATSGNYLILNTRNVDMRYYDRFSGQYVGSIPRGDLATYAFQNFNLANDQEGNLLSCNLSLAGADFVIYRWNKDALNSAPTPFVKWTNNTGGQVGRKLSIKGDLNGDAVVFATATFSGKILRWEVKGGVLVSQTPEILTYKGKTWNYLGDVIAEGPTVNDNLFVSGYPGDLAYANVKTGEPIATFDLAGAGYVVNQSIDHVEFNGAKYLAAVDVIYSWSGKGYLYDVTAPASLSTPASDANYGNFRVFATPVIGASNNGNSTGDIILRVSEDGYKMVLYTLVTNGGISAYEFDCVDVDNLF